MSLRGHQSAFQISNNGGATWDTKKNEIPKVLVILLKIVFQLEKSIHRRCLVQKQAFDTHICNFEQLYIYPSKGY